MVQNATGLNELQGFRLNDNDHIEMLLFVEDTITPYVWSWNNLWSLKVILWGIEMASGLKVNLYKSKFFGLKFQVDFVESTSSFLSYSIGTFPFNFLGAPIGINQRGKESWLHLGCLFVKPNNCQWEEDLRWSTQSCPTFLYTIYLSTKFRKW